VSKWIVWLGQDYITHDRPALQVIQTNTTIIIIIILFFIYFLLLLLLLFVFFIIIIIITTDIIIDNIIGLLWNKLTVLLGLSS